VDENFQLGTSRAWVQPFADWAEDRQHLLDFQGAQVPAKLQRLLINGLPGMAAEYGQSKWGERIGRHCAYLLFVGLFAGVALVLTGLGVAAFRALT
jgi:hypothetical protein